MASRSIRCSNGWSGSILEDEEDDMRRSVVRILGPLCGPNANFVLVAIRIAVLGALRAPKQTLPASRGLCWKSRAEPVTGFVLALLTASAMTILSAQQSG